MKQLNLYINEKLIINKNIEISKETIISNIIDITDDLLNKFGIEKSNYSIYQVDNEKSGLMVNSPDECNLLSVNFRSKLVGNIKNTNGYTFENFINKFKEKLEIELHRANCEIKEVKIAKNRISGQLKIHIILK